MADNDATEPDAAAEHDEATTHDEVAADSDGGGTTTSGTSTATGDEDLDDDLDDELDDDGLDGGHPPTTKAVRYAQIGLVAAAVVILVIVLLTKGGDDKADENVASGDKTETTTADGKPASPKPRWPKEVEGRPPALGSTGDAPAPSAGDAAPGVYIWSDFDGWHMWVVNGEGVPAVNGTLTSNDAVQKAVLAVDGAGTVDIADKVVTFGFPTEPGVVGMDFNPGFYANNLVITVNGPDGPLDASKVFLGKTSAPAPFPLVLAKEVQD